MFMGRTGIILRPALRPGEAAALFPDRTAASYQQDMFAL